MEASSWDFFFLGGLHALRGGERVDRFRAQKFGFLLAYLATQPSRQHTREELCDLLWPEADVEAGRVNLRTALASLRKQFGDALVLTQGKTYVQLDPQRFQTDVARFEALRKQAAQREDPALYREALALYKGPFLPACYDAWALAERERLAERYCAASLQLIRLLTSPAERAEALGIARQALTVDPLRDELQGEVIRLLLLSGETAQAQKHYDEFARLLGEQLGLEPSEAVQRLLKETRPAPPRAEPPASAAPSVALPQTVTHFFGRAAELERIERAFAEGVRLLTLTGPGGAGKTRLAVEAGRRVAEAFPGGVAFVPLADLRAGQSLPEAVLRALGNSPGAEPLEQLIVALAVPGRRLLLLDNAEHLVDAVAALAQTLLQRQPQVTLLVTSRNPLRCEGEREAPVPPLSEAESVALFVDRTQAIRPDFRPSAGNAAALSAISARLDGIPLALELAASRAQVLTPAQILERLDQRLDFLVSRRRDATARHQTLRAAIDWSYQMLDPALQRFFCRLSVFRGGWTLEAAEAVCGEPFSLEYLTHLRECSLVVTEEVGETMRYRLLETLREYAQERLGDDAGRQLTHRHQDYYLELLRRAESPSNYRMQRESVAQREGVAYLEPDYDNLRAAMERCATEPDRAPVGLELCTLLWRFWNLRGYYTEGRGYIDRFLAGVERAPTRLQAQIHLVRGSLALAQNDYAEALPDLDVGLRLAREAGDSVGVGHALNALANVWREHGDYERARDYLEEALRVREEIGDRRGVAGVLNNLGNILFNLGDVERSTDYYRRALTINREEGNLLWVAVNLNNLGRNRQHVGDYGVAHRYYEEALRLRRSLNDVPGIVTMLTSLGGIALEQREVVRALALFQDALQTSLRFGRKSVVAGLLQNCGFCALRLDQPATAAQLLGCAAALLAEAEFTQVPWVRTRLEEYRTMARQALGETAFDAAWEQGGLLSLDEAVGLAQSLSAAATDPGAGRPPDSGRTRAGSA